MKDPNILFKEIADELTSSGQLFETRDYKDSNGITHKEYAAFPDNLRGYFDFGLLHADKEFIVYESERFLYKDVIAKAAQVGNALISEGIKKGDRVAICMQNNPEFIFAYMLPFVVGCALIKPTSHSLSVATLIVSGFNICIHSVSLSKYKWFKWFVTPSEHLHHHETKSSIYSAPTISWGKIFKKK